MELTRAVGGALGVEPAGALGLLDLDSDGRISIAELIGAVANALGACTVS